MTYYIANNNVQQGPFELDDLPNHGLRPDSLVWREGMSDWKRAADVPEVVALLSRDEVHAAPQPATPTVPQAAHGAQHQPNYQLQYHGGAVPPTNGLAIASLICGIVAYPLSILYCAGFVPALLALIFGLVSRSRIAADPNQGGAGLALAGTILGGIYLGLAGIVIVIAIIIGIASAM